MKPHISSLPVIPYRIAAILLSLYVAIGLLSPWLASKEPIVCFGNQNCINALIPYDASTLHTDRKNIPTFTDSRHILGTDILGRDVAAGLISGTRKSLWIGLATAILSGFFGCWLGISAAYFGDQKYRVNRVGFCIAILIFLIGMFYISFEWLIFGQSQLKWGIGSLALIAGCYWLSRNIGRKRQWTVNVDLLVSKMIEVRKSIPSLFLLLAILPVFTTRSIVNVIIVLSLFLWSYFAQYARAETMRIRSENYIRRAEMLGLGNWTIMWKHIFPNIIPTLMVVFCFSVAACILAESSISFLGIGLAIDDITWGTMLSEGRKTLVWWMVVWPGLAIFVLVWSLNTIASYLQEKYRN